MLRHWAWLAMLCGAVAGAACLVDFEDRPVYTSRQSTGGTGGSSGITNGATDNSGTGGSSAPTTGGASNSGGGSQAVGGSGGGGGSTGGRGSGGGGGSTGSGGSGGSTSEVSDPCTGTTPDCSACQLLSCGDVANCCVEASYFGALTFPTWVEQPDLVTGYSEEPDQVRVAGSFTSSNQAIGIRYSLGARHSASSMSLDAEVSGDWTLTLTLEEDDGANGCSFYVYGDQVDTTAYFCWGSYAGTYYMAYVNFSQVSIAMENPSGRSGNGTLVLNSLAWRG